MTGNQSAFIFPAFASDYADHPAGRLDGFSDLFNDLIGRAATSADPDLRNFDFTGQTFLGDELRTQYVTFIYSCAAAELLRQRGILPAITAGYSMGIYAALYDSGAVTFETGLRLIGEAYRSMTTKIKPGVYGMGTLIGLDRIDIERLITENSIRAAITNQNASHAFVVSGYREDIMLLNDLAREEGALNARDLSVNVPYHAHHLAEAAKDFSERIHDLEINTPGIPVISLIDQRLITTTPEIRDEISRNLHTPLHWMDTMLAMTNHGISRFIECGASFGLTRNARFIKGDYRFYSLDTIPWTSGAPSPSARS